MVVLNKKLIFITIMVLFLSSTLLVATVDPAWYNINFTFDDWLTQGDTDLADAPLTNMYLGHFDINRASGYQNTSSWKNSDKIWGPEESNLTFVLTTTSPRARLEHIGKQNTNINMSYEVNIGGTSHSITEPQNVKTATMNYYLGSNIYINVAKLPTPLTDWRGSYTSFLTFQIYAEYGTNNQVLLKEFTYTVKVCIRKESEPVITNLTINKYPSAENINIKNLQQGGPYLTVGSVEFWSNDTYSTNAYSLKISPKINPLLGDFTFVHANSPSSFTYKVHVPGRTTPTDKQFTVPVPTPASGLAWSDFIEIAISGVYTPTILPVGEYTSTIVIELVSGY